MYAVGMNGSSINGKNGDAGEYQRSMVIRDIKPKEQNLELFGAIHQEQNPSGAVSIYFSRQEQFGAWSSRRGKEQNICHQRERQPSGDGHLQKNLIRSRWERSSRLAGAVLTTRYKSSLEYGSEREEEQQDNTTGQQSTGNTVDLWWKRTTPGGKTVVIYNNKCYFIHFVNILPSYQTT